MYSCVWCEFLYKSDMGHFPIFTITEHELQKCPKTSMAEDYTTRIITKKSLEAFCCKIKNCDW